jgi:plastocyanin
MLLLVGGCGGNGPTSDQSGGGGREAATPSDTGQAEPSSSSGDASAEPATEVTLTARDIAFEPVEIVVPSGEEVTITFRNRDAGMPHLLHVDAGAAGDFSAPQSTGPATQELTFTIDEPGTYSFVCDIHANMRGRLIVV